MIEANVYKETRGNGKGEPASPGYAPTASVISAELIFALCAPALGRSKA